MKYVTALAVTLALAACGGGGAGSGSAPSGASSPAVADGSGTSAAPSATPSPCRFAASSEPSVAAAGTHPAATAAARFLGQATFGATPASLAALGAGTYESWLAVQFALPQRSHLACVDAELAVLAAGGKTVDQSHFLQSWWGQVLTGDDQLRQRVAFALSEILVVSFDGNLSEDIRAVAAYYDVLGRHAFGNYRDLLEAVSLHPAMAIYLSHLRNQKEDGKGRMPDENYAREIMQLFSIGLYELNDDGSPRLVAGKPVETYTNADVAGLAKVFTGYGWGGKENTDAWFFNNTTSRDGPHRVIPLQAYPKFHSVSEKRFLGTVIPPQGSASVESMASDLKTALDTLFNHPNVGPFIGRQLIQRLVTSNPSPAYVTRVVAAFNTGIAYGFGGGRRGDMKATVAAVLLDPEARPPSPGNDAGKLREPVVRLANWARAFGVVSASGSYKIGNTDSTASALGQTPMRAPSVFNFYRPGYVPPVGSMAAAALAAPEMQTTHETSVAGYLNFMQAAIQNGVGTTDAKGIRDLRSAYAAEIALADDGGQLIERLNVLLMAGAMKASTRNAIRGAVDSIAIPTNNAATADTARRQRVHLAVFLAMAAPEYLVQK